MITATQRPVSLRVGDFQVESLGVEWPDYFQGYGLGPRSTFNYCAYGIGDTEEEALADCLEMAAQQGFDVDGETEERIRAEYGPADDSETALEALGVEEEGEDLDETPFFHVGIKWNCREEERSRASRSLPTSIFSTIRITALKAPLRATRGFRSGATRAVSTPIAKRFPTGT